MFVSEYINYFLIPTTNLSSGTQQAISLFQALNENWSVLTLTGSTGRLPARDKYETEKKFSCYTALFELPPSLYENRNGLQASNIFISS